MDVGVQMTNQELAISSYTEITSAATGQDLLEAVLYLNNRQRNYSPTINAVRLVR